MKEHISLIWGNDRCMNGTYGCWVYNAHMVWSISHKIFVDLFVRKQTAANIAEDNLVAILIFE